MNIANTLITPSILSLFGLVAVLGGIGVWFLIRRKRQRLWLPTLRLMTVDSSPLPKLRLVRPPLVAFLCFLLSVLALLWLSLQPNRLEFSAVIKHNNRTHVFVDLSPSTEAASPEQRRLLLGEIYTAYQGVGDLTVSHSLDLQPKSVASQADFAAFVASLPTQRQGTELGPMMTEQLDLLGTIDRLIIASDRDKYSWSSFNWQVLTDKLEIIHANLEVAEGEQNVFIDDVVLSDQKLDRSSSWTVSIARNTDQGAVQGRLSLEIAGVKLRNLVWSLPAGQGHIEITVSLKAKELESIGALRDQDILKWDLTVEGANAITADDTFYSYFRGFRRKILLVSQNEGEMFLEDSMHHLQTVLEVLEFDTKRIDKLDNEAEYLDYPLWIIAGHDSAVGRYCPKKIPELYRAKRSGDPSAMGKRLPTIWLMPRDQGASFEGLCHCYSNLADDAAGKGDKPAYCEGLEVRDQYIGVLNSVGALQIGGQLDDLQGAWAFRRKIAAIDLDIFALTLPLKPSRSIGISYDMMPKVVRFFLELANIESVGGGGRGVFPRLVGNQRGADNQVLQSNVPRSESLLALWSQEYLPKPWAERALYLNQSREGLREQKNPLFWLKLCFWLVIAMIVLEIIWILLRRIRQLGKSSALVLIASASFWAPHPAEASVKIAGAGYGDLSEDKLLSLMQQVSARTSIELSPKFNAVDFASQTPFAVPWLWLASPQVAQRRTADLQRWLQRGGFLIIENFMPVEQIAAQGLDFAGRWQAIPPDHELMRSFHLLAALPPCNDLVWHGLHFDDRIAAIGIPFSLLKFLLGQSKGNSCVKNLGQEEAQRIFINILMVALTTDYKKDQIHLPEILKRLR